MAPVVASNANRFVRGIVVCDPGARTEEKLPPTMILLPTWAMDSTYPSPTQGVQSAGLSETT